METISKEQIVNNGEHAIILSEIRNLSNVMKESIAVFRDESLKRDDRFQQELDTLKKELNEEKIKTQSANQTINQLMALAKWAGTPVIIVAVTALGKAMGII